MPKTISVTQRGDYSKTNRFLSRILERHYMKKLEQYGIKGVEALANATPVGSGKTAGSWSYNIVQVPGRTTIEWTNSNVNKGVNIAIILQYGHGTRNGGYVQGRDYINPAIQPIFQEMAESAWKEVVSG